MKNINFDKLWQLYKERGCDTYFQIKCVKELQPITEVFAKEYNISEEHNGELKSYLYAGYFYSFRTYDESKGMKLSSWIWQNSKTRTIDFIRHIKRVTIEMQELEDMYAYTIEQYESSVINDDVLCNRLLNDAGIDGLEYEIFIRKKGLFGNKEMRNGEIVEYLGLGDRIKDAYKIEKYMNEINRKLLKYKKENAE
ncbi:MAG: hypothetical protein MJ197_08675 [Bacteroidales bacterium]|nr:hypothetical protein [Bacteroidales bacterium]